MLSQKIYRPAEDGKPDFYSKVKNVTTFSDKGFFKTVFSGGDDMVAEMQALKKKEADNWKAKLIVANPHFSTNTVISKSEQTDKFHDIRQDEIKKQGYRLSPQRVKLLKKRQLLAEKGPSVPPVN